MTKVYTPLWENLVMTKQMQRDFFSLSLSLSHEIICYRLWNIYYYSMIMSFLKPMALVG
jgi:hypothetical protein